MKPTATRSLNGGTQDVYKFTNGYAASVVNGPFSYGTELGVMIITGKGDYDIRLTYDTPITDDVVGHLTDDELETTLKDIESLPKIN